MTMSNEQKATLFDESAPIVHQNTIRSHFGGSQAHMYHFVNKSIVDVIIKEILFHPDNANDETTKGRALAIIEDVAGPE